MPVDPNAMQQKIDAALDAAAAKPASVSGEFGSVSNRSVNELIALDRYNQGKIAAANGRTGFTIRPIRAGGANS